MKSTKFITLMSIATIIFGFYWGAELIPPLISTHFSRIHHTLIYENGRLTFNSKEEGRGVGKKNNGDTSVCLFFFEPIPINSADVDLLVTLPGVGSKLAEQIICSREQNGNFQDASDLLTINGIGVGKMRRISKKITFQVQN